VVYVVTSIIEEENGRHSEIWIAAADGSAAPRRLTTPGLEASNPRWTPDGSLIAFSSSRPGGNGESNIWFIRMDGSAGEAFQITGLGGSPVMDPANQWIAFTKSTPPPPPLEPTYESEFERKTVERFDGRIYHWMNFRFDRRGYLADPSDPNATPPRELYVIPRDGGAPRQLTELGIDGSGAQWRHDGGGLAFTADKHQRNEHSYERADVWIVTLDGQLTRLTDDEFDYSNPAWSPDGESIVVRGNEGLDVIIREGRDRGAASDLFVIDADGIGEPVNITANWDQMPGSPTWSPDGHFIYFSASVTGTSHLYRVPANGGAVEQITTGNRRLGSFSYSADFQQMAYTVGDATLPGDIFASSIEGRNERRLTEINGELLADLELANPDRILYESEDGTEIEGWVLTPRGYEAGGGTYPMVLTIHGGPHGAYGYSFSFEHQLLAAGGHVVLYTNPRASTGYGEDFRWGTWGGWGFNDFDDIMAGVDYTLEHFAVDPERIGVTGYSYGGYLTNWAITHTDRFAGAIAGASISNWVSDYGTADIPRTKESEFFGPPWEERSRELLMRSSPIIYAGNVTTPTMFVHGEYDHRVPIEEAEQMYVALKKQNVPAKFVRYPESYHGGWTPWRYVHRMYVQMDWWEEYLGR
jgi:dipeptidyl aminopeptidase/acylaminoacyl peptidase